MAVLAVWASSDPSALRGVQRVGRLAGSGSIHHPHRSLSLFNIAVTNCTAFRDGMCTFRAAIIAFFPAAATGTT